MVENKRSSLLKKEKKKWNDGVGEDEATPAQEAAIDVEALLKKAPKSKIPTGIKPMLATLVDKPSDDKDWVFEAASVWSW